MIWKCPGRFLGVQFLESLKTECVVLALKESLWVAGSGGWDGVERGVPGWGISARQVGVFWFWVYLLLFPGKRYL